MASFTTIGVSILTFIILDGIWLGVIMKDFYVRQLLPIARTTNGSFAPLWAVASLVYVLLGVGVAIFVVPRSNSATAAAGLGALFGLVVYGVYDLTNYSTLAQWPAIVTVADIVWGSAACAAVAAGVYAVGLR
jgi:uncharacterized membrane protein